MSVRLLVPICSRRAVRPGVILFSRRRGKAILTGLPEEPPPDGIWIAGVVWQIAQSGKQKAETALFGPRPAALRLDPSGLGVHAPITDHCSLPPSDPGHAGPECGPQRQPAVIRGWRLRDPRGFKIA